MTNQQALVRGVLSSFQVDSFQAEKAMMDAGIQPDGTYNPSNEKAIDECAVRILHTKCESTISEGGYSVSYNRDAIESFVEKLCAKWGLDNPFVPTIKGVQPW